MTQAARSASAFCVAAMFVDVLEHSLERLMTSGKPFPFSSSSFTSLDNKGECIFHSGKAPDCTEDCQNVLKPKSRLSQQDRPTVAVFLLWKVIIKG